MMNWLRWKLAYWLNDRWPDACWDRLVKWAAFSEPFWEILDMRHTAGFCERVGELPACGKCEGK